MSEKEVSIVIPVNNAAAYISKTLDGILEQSFESFEILVVDDGSTDNTAEIIKQYAAKDQRIEYLHQKHSFAGCARNLGLDHAKGEYVMFLDADDSLLNYGLESAMAKVRKYGVDCLKYCAIPFDDELNLTVDDPEYLHSKIQQGNFNRYLNAAIDNDVLKINPAAWSGIYRRSFLLQNDIRFSDLPAFNDRNFFIKVLYKAEKLVISRDFVLLHHIDTPEKFSRKLSKNYNALLRSVSYTENWLKQQNCDAELYKKLMGHELNFLMISAAKLGMYGYYSEEIVEKTLAYLEALEYPLYIKYVPMCRTVRDSAEKRRKIMLAESNFGSAPVAVQNRYKIIYHDRCNEPKVSVVVPTYNQEEYLNQALYSLCNQSLEELEFLCVNDGATDASMAILKQYAEIDHRIIIIDKPNTGYGNSMNVGIDAARGEYIGILEPDDYVYPKMFEELYKIAVEHDLDLVKSDFNRFWINEDGSERIKRFEVGFDGYYNRVIKPIDELTTFNFTLNTWCGIYKKGFLNRYNIRHNETPGASYQDNGFWLQTFMYAERAWFSSEVFYMNRRDNPNSSVFSRGKFYAVTNEYNFIWEKLSADPKKLRRLETIFYRKKFSNFLTTYYRLASDLKVDYLCHMRDEFAEPVRKGLLTREEMDLYHWKMLNDIIRDPHEYYEPVRVSVIIPAFNVEPYIRQCLDSILARDEIHMEVIVVDDGSTDNTLAILKEYETRDARVCVISQEHKNAGAARNNGMQYATGEYLAFLDADDFYEPEMLRMAYEASSSNHSDVTVWRNDDYLDLKRTYRSIGNSIRSDLLPETQPFAGTDIKKNVFMTFIGWPWDKMFRTEFVRENHLHFQEQRTTNDMLFVFSAIVKAQAIITVDEIYSYHRRLGKGKSLTSSREESWDCFYQALLALRQQLKDWDLFERFEQDFINWSLNLSLWYLHWLKGEAFIKLYNRLKEEWFENLGIVGRSSDYFYYNYDYSCYLSIMENDPLDYLFDRIDILSERIANSKSRENESKLKKEIKGLKHQIDQKDAYLTEIMDSTSWKFGRKITYLPGKLKKIFRHYN